MPCAASRALRRHTRGKLNAWSTDSEENCLIIAVATYTVRRNGKDFPRAWLLLIEHH